MRMSTAVLSPQAHVQINFGMTCAAVSRLLSIIGIPALVQTGISPLTVNLITQALDTGYLQIELTQLAVIIITELIANNFNILDHYLVCGAFDFVKQSISASATIESSLVCTLVWGIRLPECQNYELNG